MTLKIKNFFHDFLFHYSNGIITLFLSFVYTIVIANFLGPAGYGLVTYVINFVTALGALFGLNLLATTILTIFPRDKSKDLFKKAFFLNLVISLAIFIALLVFAEPIIIFLSRDDAFLLRIASVLVILVSSNSILSSVFQAAKLFGKNLKAECLIDALNLGLAVFFVIILNQSYYGVVYARVISLLLGLFVFANFLKAIKFSEAKINLKEIKLFASYAIPNTFVRGLYNQTLIVIMGIFISNAALGVYYLGQKVASYFILTPISKLTEVALPYSVEKWKDKFVLGNYVSLIFKASLIGSVILTIVLLLLGPLIITLFFPKYEVAIPLFPLFALTYIVASFTVLNNVFLSLNKLKWILVANSLTLLSIIVLGPFLILNYQLTGLILTDLISRLISAGVFVVGLHKVGVKVSFIPVLHDLKFFYSNFKAIIKGHAGKLKMH